jgi:hypothetical protein
VTSLEGPPGVAQTKDKLSSFLHLAYQLLEQQILELDREMSMVSKRGYERRRIFGEIIVGIACANRKRKK